MIDESVTPIVVAVISNALKPEWSYINKTYVNELFAKYFCGKDDCSGFCTNCVKGEFLNEIMDDKEHSE